jgi:PAS domain S-box-containing protein
MDDRKHIDPQTILDCLGDGVYVTDLERRILYWNKAAERITGWQAGDILGRSCFDGILCHINKDGHPMCGKEICPLRRAMVTGVTGECPLMFAKASDGRLIPMQTAVAPLRDQSGEIIGGVEVFRDLTLTLRDIERAKTIQTISLQHDLPRDERVTFNTHYVPHDIVGGDFYGIRQLNADHYGFFLADVMGHGLAAALYTMYLSALWDRYCPWVATPSAFALKISDELFRVVQGREAFAAGVCGILDLDRLEIVFSGAGNPPAILVHANGEYEQLVCSGLPLGVMKGAPYEETRVQVQPGDCLLFYSDGAVEVDNADGVQLGTKGLVSMLKTLGYPDCDIQSTAIEEALLKYSNTLRLEDDLTFLEMRFPSRPDRQPAA